jgi:hypothetical protein
MNKILKLAATIGLIAALLALTGCGELKPEKKSQFMLNTNCTITVYDKNAAKILDDTIA